MVYCTQTDPTFYPVQVVLENEILPETQQKGQSIYKIRKRPKRIRFDPIRVVLYNELPPETQQKDRHIYKIRKRPKRIKFESYHTLENDNKEFQDRLDPIKVVLENEYQSPIKVVIEDDQQTPSTDDAEYQVDGSGEFHKYNSISRNSFPSRPIRVVLENYDEDNYPHSGDYSDSGEYSNSGESQWPNYDRVLLGLDSENDIDMSESSGDGQLRLAEGSGLEEGRFGRRNTEEGRLKYRLGTA